MENKNKSVWIIIGLLGVSAICLFVIALFTLPSAQVSEPTTTVVSEAEQTKAAMIFQDVLKKRYAITASKMFEDCGPALDLANVRMTEFDNDNTVAINDVWIESMNTAFAGLETYCIPIRSVDEIVPEDLKNADDKLKLASSEIELFIKNYRDSIESYRKADYETATIQLESAKTNFLNFTIYLSDVPALLPK